MPLTEGEITFIAKLYYFCETGFSPSVIAFRDASSPVRGSQGRLSLHPVAAALSAARQLLDADTVRSIMLPPKP